MQAPLRRLLPDVCADREVCEFTQSAARDEGKIVAKDEDRQRREKECNGYPEAPITMGALPIGSLMMRHPVRRAWL